MMSLVSIGDDDVVDMSTAPCDAVPTGADNIADMSSAHVMLYPCRVYRSRCAPYPRSDSDALPPVGKTLLYGWEARVSWTGPDREYRRAQTTSQRRRAAWYGPSSHAAALH